VTNAGHEVKEARRSMKQRQRSRSHGNPWRWWTKLLARLPLFTNEW